MCLMEVHKIKKTRVLSHPGFVQKAAHLRARSMWFLGRPIPSGSEAQGRSIFYLYTSTGRL
jgi:hypothetical protein